MRVNVYAEEITDRVEIVPKTIEGQTFTGLRFYLETPVSVGNGSQVRGPFIHRPGDDDSSAVTFWGKQDLRPVLRKALAMLDRHYERVTVNVVQRPFSTAAGARNAGEPARSTPEGLEKDDSPRKPGA